MKFVIRNIKESDTSVINHLTRGVDFMQIDFDFSRICFSKTGEMIGFVLLEKKPVSDFFGGRIPLQWNTYKDIRSDLIKKTEGLFKDLQFKACIHITGNTNLHYLAFSKMIKELHVMIWSETLPFECSEFIHYNNLLWIYDPLRKEEEKKRTAFQSLKEYRDRELLKLLNPEFFPRKSIWRKAMSVSENPDNCWQHLLLEGETCASFSKEVYLKKIMMTVFYLFVILSKNISKTNNMKDGCIFLKMYQFHTIPIFMYI